MGKFLQATADNAFSFFMSLLSFTGLFYGSVDITSLSLVDIARTQKHVGVFTKTRKPRTLFARR